MRLYLLWYGVASQTPVGLGGPLKVADFRLLARFSQEKMQKHEVLRSLRAVVEVLCFESGQAQRSVKHADSDRIYFVLEGAGRFTIGRSSREFRAGSAVLASAGEEHGVVNIAEERLLLLAVTSPPSDK